MHIPSKSFHYPLLKPVGALDMKTGPDRNTFWESLQWNGLIMNMPREIKL